MQYGITHHILIMRQSLRVVSISCSSIYLSFNSFKSNPTLPAALPKQTSQMRQFLQLLSEKGFLNLTDLRNRQILAKEEMKQAQGSMMSQLQTTQVPTPTKPTLEASRIISRYILRLAIFQLNRTASLYFFLRFYRPQQVYLHLAYNEAMADHLHSGSTKACTSISCISFDLILAFWLAIPYLASSQVSTRCIYFSISLWMSSGCSSCSMLSRSYLPQLVLAPSRSACINCPSTLILNQSLVRVKNLSSRASTGVFYEYLSPSSLQTLDKRRCTLRLVTGTSLKRAYLRSFRVAVGLIGKLKGVTLLVAVSALNNLSSNISEFLNQRLPLSRRTELSSEKAQLSVLVRVGRVVMRDVTLGKMVDDILFIIIQMRWVGNIGVVRVIVMSNMVMVIMNKGVVTCGVCAGPTRR